MPFFSHVAPVALKYDLLLLDTVVLHSRRPLYNLRVILSHGI